jgi:hypothetical protein
VVDLVMQSTLPPPPKNPPNGCYKWGSPSLK